ncbi:hypothetical protein N665_0383s0015 [Sinapis alba]|nr:hypothetical protein N665_0383s0015 [Sinapis alba]
MPEEIQVLVVERVACNSITYLFSLSESSKSMKALANWRRVYHFYYVLSVSWGLNMPLEFLKTCYAERNPSTLYLKVYSFYTFNLHEEGLAFMKLAEDAGYERVVYTQAMTQKIFWDDEEYFAGLPSESVDMIGKLVRSVKWGWGLWHGDAFRVQRAPFISAFLLSFYSCKCAPLLMQQCHCLWHIDISKDDNMCDRCFWIKEVGLFFCEFEQIMVIRDTMKW